MLKNKRSLTSEDVTPGGNLWR